MNFKEYTSILKEAKFREQSENLVKEVKKITQIYVNKFMTSSNKTIKDLYKNKTITYIKDEPHWSGFFKSILKDYSVPQYFESVGKVTVLDKQTNKNKKIPFIVVYGVDTVDYAIYSDEFEIVILFDNNLNDLPLRRIEQIVLHELTHAFQEYKDTSAAYAKNSEKEDFDPTVYFEEPVEWDSHLNEIAYIIRQQYKQFKGAIRTAKDPAAKRVLQNRFEKFLLELQLFITSPGNVYFDYKELPVPSFIQAHTEFVKTLMQRRSNWTSFKQKMAQLYKELTGKDIPRS